MRVIAAWAARSLGSEAGVLPAVGKSRTCPTLDFTMKSEPKYLLIVFAFAGDSTMTSDLPMNATSTQFCARDAPLETAQTAECTGQ